jgi:hypothetical protein
MIAPAKTNNIRLVQLLRMQHINMDQPSRREDIRSAAQPLGRWLRPATSVSGQSRRFGRRPTTSGLPLETDIVGAGRHVSKVPGADIG